MPGTGTQGRLLFGRSATTQFVGHVGVPEYEALLII